ncbi:MAG TPA: PilZ domain-containing protein [Desulfatiglandales bacterium]|nr:PilZ domain-containing protein [Desulfatiglandales bacterium]
MYILSRPSSLFESIRKPPYDCGLEKRRFQRTDCLIAIRYEVKGHDFGDSLRNISEGGGYLQTFRAFSVGEEISLELPAQDHGGKVVGDVVWVGPKGIGLKFRVSDRALMQKLFPGKDNQNRESNITKKEAYQMGKIKQKKLRWEPAAGEESAKYKLYWSENGTLDYTSSFAEVGAVTQVILPDDIPSFPRVAGNLELGITAVNQAGNESDITKLSAYFDFTVPVAPKSLVVEDL